MTTVTKTTALQDEISVVTYTFIQRVEALAHSAMSIISLWTRRHRGRLELAQMNEHMLADIGMTRAGVVAEIDKPFWRD